MSLILKLAAKKKKRVSTSYVCTELAFSLFVSLNELGRSMNWVPEVYFAVRQDSVKYSFMCDDEWVV